MKKIIAILTLAIVMAGSSPALAVENGAKAPGNTVFNKVSDYFSTFDRPFARPGNKQGFWNATADWLRNIDK